MEINAVQSLLKKEPEEPVESLRKRKLDEKEELPPAKKIKKEKGNLLVNPYYGKNTNCTQEVSKIKVSSLDK